MNAPVVIHIHSSSGETTVHPVDVSSGSMSEPILMDPHKVHTEFPDRWQAYIQTHFRNLADVIANFHVSEKTARNWWNGVTGANGAHVAMAVNIHPIEAPKILFAA